MDRIDSPLTATTKLLESQEGRVLVAIAGLPGGGKSTVASLLGQAVNRKWGAGTAVALGMDGFHFSKADLRAMPDPEAAFARRGAPWTFDVEHLAARLAALRHGYTSETVPWPEFEHGVGDPVADATLVGSGVRLVIVEGLYLLSRNGAWEQVSGQFDARWYLDTPMPDAIERLVSRHQQAWNISREKALERVAQNDRLNALIVQDTKPNATAILADQPLEFWSALG